MGSEKDITGLILTYNEEPNIARTLTQLTWLPRIVVVDSFSTDHTREIAGEFANTDIIEHAFETHTKQWNFGLKQTGITTEWVLALDADYFLPEAVSTEMGNRIAQSDNTAAYWLHFDYAIKGRVIQSGIYPPVQALYRERQARYEPDGHTQRVVVKGNSKHLQNRAIHDDRKPFSRWLQSQLRYAKLEAEKISHTPAKKLGRNDRLRKRSKLTPFLIFIYCILLRSGWKDGHHGWLYGLERLIAELILQYELIKLKIDKTE